MKLVCLCTLVLLLLRLDVSTPRWSSLTRRLCHSAWLRALQEAAVWAARTLTSRNLAKLARYTGKQRAWSERIHITPDHSVLTEAQHQSLLKNYRVSL